MSSSNGRGVARESPEASSSSASTMVDVRDLLFFVVKIVGGRVSVTGMQSRVCKIVVVDYAIRAGQNNRRERVFIPR